MSLGVVLPHLVFPKIVFDSRKIFDLKLIFKIFLIHVKSTNNLSIKELDQDISLMKALSTNILSLIHSLLVFLYFGIL